MWQITRGYCIYNLQLDEDDTPKIPRSQDSQSLARQETTPLSMGFSSATLHPLLSLGAFLFFLIGGPPKWSRSCGIAGVFEFICSLLLCIYLNSITVEYLLVFREVQSCDWQDKAVWYCWLSCPWLTRRAAYLHFHPVMWACFRIRQSHPKPLKPMEFCWSSWPKHESSWLWMKKLLESEKY